MELKIKFKEREIEYSLGSSKGKTLEALIKALPNNSVDKVLLSGESRSYTLLRQLALFVNLLRVTKDVEVDLASKSFSSKEGFLLPIYE